MSAQRRRLAWAGWAAGLALVIAALAAQVSYAYDVADCARMDLLALCIGPLDGWVLPTTVAIGIALVAIGAWRLASDR